MGDVAEQTLLDESIGPNRPRHPGGRSAVSWARPRQSTPNPKRSTTGTRSASDGPTSRYTPPERPHRHGVPIPCVRPETPGATCVAIVRVVNSAPPTFAVAEMSATEFTVHQPRAGSRAHRHRLSDRSLCTLSCREPRRIDSSGAVSDLLVRSCTHLNPPNGFTNSMLPATIRRTRPGPRRHESSATCAEH